jgi:hypothetical protein
MDWSLEITKREIQPMAFRSGKLASCRGEILVAGLALGCSLAIGCGKTVPRGNLPRGKVAIAISYGGKPITEGRVDLQNAQSGEGGGAEVNQEGIVTLPSVVEGTYVVTVNPPTTAAIPVPGQPDSKPKEFPNIPEAYRTVAASPLKAEVKRGETTEYKFDLKQAK